eukprot:m.177769 g.177769  ORF g.177769 m.177769 type:complete len:272 (-) comp14417_c0_seq1:141-956(-)
MPAGKDGVDLSATEYDGFRDAITAALKHNAKGGADDAYVSMVRKKAKLSNGSIHLDLVMCSGTTCFMGEYTVKPDGTVTDGAPGADAQAASTVAPDAIRTATLETKAGDKVAAKDVLPGKIVALFFSAHWCPGCVIFTPILAKAYTEARAAGKQIEIIFVSSDTSEKSMADYMKESHGDWLRVPYNDPLREALKKHYGSFAGREVGNFPGVKRREGIPNLIVIGVDGEELVFEPGEGSVAIESKGAGAFDEWSKHAWPSVDANEKKRDRDD